MDRAQVDQALDRTLEFLQRGWTKDTAARTATGEECNSTDPRATCWCVTGAVSAATYGGGRDEAEADRLYSAATRRIRAVLDGRGHRNRAIVDYNDAPERTLLQVLDLVREARASGDPAEWAPAEP